MSPGEVLAVDVGATSIRMRRFDAAGEPLGPKSRRPTPYPCRPERLANVIVERSRREPVDWIGIGFPGAVDQGVVVDAANLTRLGGLSTPLDEEMATQWRGFALAQHVAERTGVSVRMENDATMAALGCVIGAGVELMVTLGTGCGLALTHEGVRVEVRDVGAEMLRGSATYDDLLGELGRRRDQTQWMVHVVSAVTALATEFSATTIHLAGGNARRLSPKAFGGWSQNVIIERHDPALRGAWRACYS